MSKSKGLMRASSVLLAAVFFMGLDDADLIGNSKYSAIYTVQ